MTSGDWDRGDTGNVGGEGPQRLPEGAEGFQRVAREGLECRGSVSARVSSDRIRRKKKERKDKRKRAEKKGVRTSDDFFGKREKINEKKEKNGKEQ